MEHGATNCPIYGSIDELSADAVAVVTPTTATPTTSPAALDQAPPAPPGANSEGSSSGVVGVVAAVGVVAVIVIVVAVVVLHRRGFLRLPGTARGPVYTQVRVVRIWVNTSRRVCSMCSM